MALRRAPTPVTATQLQLVPTGPLFEPLTAGILLDHATEADGFEEHFATAMGHLADDGNFGDSLDGHLLDGDFTAGEFEGSNFSPIIADLPAFQMGGDAALGDFEGAVGDGGGPGGDPPAPNPPAPPQPPPDTGGGGGGGGGGGSGPCTRDIMDPKPLPLCAG